jgi:tetratricopeptide (TPR) repeat protein
MTSRGADGGPAGPRPASGSAVSGRIPPLAESYSPRPETGFSLRSLPAGQATVLVAADDVLAGGLAGVGGTGKTHLAAALAREHLDERAADLVVWVSATGRDAVAAGYAQASRDAGVADPGEGPELAAAAFLDWLARTDRSWLVVLDDLSDPAVVDGYWPRGAAGRTLVTTELQDLGELPDARVMTVGALSHREALRYLSERLQADHDQRLGAPDLAAELDLLPIALGQAAAVMAETGIDCHRYRELVAGRRSEALSSSVGRYASTVAAAWSLSVELADNLPPAGMAGRALALISMLGPHGMPGLVLTSQAARAYITGSAGTGSGAAAGGDEGWARAAVYNLARAGLVTIDAGDAARTVRAHELVLTVARQNLLAAERDRAAGAAADALVQAWSSRDVPETFGQSLRDCTTHLRQAGGALLWSPQCHPVLLRAGQSLETEGLSGPAAAYWQNLLDISERELGPGHAVTLQFRDLLGAAFEASGRLDEAIATYRDVVSDQQQAAGAHHPAAAADRANLTRAYHAAGRSGDAIDLAEQTVAECEQALGPDHPDSLSARSGLADSYLAAGRAKDAIAERQRVLAAWERLQGRDDRDTIAARVGLAGAYRSADKFKDAVKHYERALADQERVQGESHPDTIATRRELALAYMLAGRLAYSVRQYERALADCEQVLGPGHPLTRETSEDLDAAAAYAMSRVGIDLRTPRRVDN